jgi:hypothetical protein
MSFRIKLSTVDAAANKLIRQAYRWDTNRDGVLSTSERSARDAAASKGDVAARGMKSFETQLVQKSWFGHEDVAVTRGGFIGGVKRGLAELRANDLNRDGFVTSDEVKTRRRTEVLTDKSQALVGLSKVL